MGELYRLRFPSGRDYIGVTALTAEARFREHCETATKKRSFAVHAAIRKYGAGAVEVQTLVIADDLGYLKALEKKAIAAFGTLAPGGYNLTAGGEGIEGLSEDAERRRVEAMRGRKQSPEASELIRQAAVRQMSDPAARARLSELAKARRASPETRARIGAATRAALSSEEVRQRIAAGTRAGLARPEVQAKLREKAAEKWSTAEARAAHAAKIKAKWDDPEWRARMIEQRAARRKGQQ